MDNDLNTAIERLKREPMCSKARDASETVIAAARRPPLTVLPYDGTRRSDLERIAAERYPIEPHISDTMRRVIRFERAAYIQGRLDQAQEERTQK